MILSLGLTGCVPDISGDTNSYADSFNTTTNTDSNNVYTSEQEGILEDGYTPDEDGVCSDGYFWCSIEGKCLPATAGATCPLAHSDEDEAEAEEINTSTN